jgi:hypothetical protein
MQGRFPRWQFSQYAARLMTPILIITMLMQAGLIVHCIKTGRNTIWVWVLLWLPGAGGIAYVAVEILPQLFGSRTAQRTMRGVGKAIDPEKDLRRLESEARHHGGVATQQRYGDELVRQGRAAEAMNVYRSALKGLYEYDVGLMQGLAQAQFAASDYTGCRTTLDLLIEKNPDFKSPDGHLLYARALEGEGDTTKALEEFKVLAGYYAGAEAAVRYAQLLRRQKQSDEARRVLSELIEHAQHAPAHYRKTQSEWLTSAERELAAL